MDSVKSAAESASVQFSQVKKAIVPALGTVVPALAAVGTVISDSIIDVTKFEIFRDFFQIISLFFSGLKDSMPESFKTVWGNISEFFSICFSCWVSDFYNDNKSLIALIVYIAKFVLVFAGSIWFYYRVRKFGANDERQGLEVTKWEMTTDFDRSLMKYLALLLTTLYLPVARDVFMVLTCDLEFEDVPTQCYEGTRHLVLCFIAALSLLVYILPVPIVFYKVIQSNKPVEKLYDAEGKERVGGYTDADYVADLQKDCSPYKSLYEPYERKWAAFKVIIMLMKLLLIIPATVLVTTNVVSGHSYPNDSNDLLLIQSIVTVIVLAAYALVCWLTRPFIKNADDFLDAIARLTTLVTALFGILTVVILDTDFVFGILLNILVGLTTFLTICLFISAVPAVQLKWKNFRQRVDLTPSRDDPLQPLIFSKSFDLHRARKLRIWFEFWDILFSQSEEFRIGWDPKKQKDDPENYVPRRLAFQYGGTPPYLLNFEGKVEERHAENKAIVESEGFASFESALWYSVQTYVNPAYTGLRINMYNCIKYLQGLDVYWDGSVECKVDTSSGVQRQVTKNNTSSTHFGKLYVIPFPFTAVIYFDDVDDMSVFSLAPSVSGVIRNDPQKSLTEFFSLIDKNMNDQEVLRRKNVRWQMRALVGHTVDHEFHKAIRKTKSRTEHYTDSEGRSQSRTVHYTVTVNFTFHQGVFGISQDTKQTLWNNIDMGRGFNATISYADGHGYDEEGQLWTNEHYTMHHGEMGVTSTFELSPSGSSSELYRLLATNEAIVRANYNTVLEKYQSYRDTRMQEYLEKQLTLSYAFWYFIYNNDLISQENLIATLANEPNPLMKALSATHSDELTMVYAKLRYFDSHPAVAFWFTFWHDVWYNNRELGAFVGHEDLLDPLRSSSICFKVMERPELETVLSNAGINGSKGCIRSGFINNVMLDELYARIDALTKGALEKVEIKPLLAHDVITTNYGYSLSMMNTEAKEQK